MGKKKRIRSLAAGSFNEKFPRPSTRIFLLAQAQKHLNLLSFGRPLDAYLLLILLAPK